MINVLSFKIEDNHSAPKILFYFKFILSSSNAYWLVQLDYLVGFLNIRILEY